MTTGTRTMNGRYTVMGADGGTGLAPVTIGRYYSRSWTGANASSVKKVRKGPKSPRANHLVLPPNAYRVDFTDEERGLVRVWDKPDGLPGPLDTTIGGFSTPLPSVDPRQLYKLIAKLQRAVYGHDFHPAAALVEGFKAIDMIYNAAVRIGASIEAVKRRDWKSLKRALPWLHPETMKGIAKTGRSTSSIILEVQYGWRPLMHDAHEAGTWLAASMDQTMRSNNRYSVSRTWQSTAKLPAHNYGSARVRFASEVTTFRARYTVLVKSITPPYVPTMWSFAEALWERVPYSFVGDWFVPIGAYLGAMNTVTGIQGTHVLSLKVERRGTGLDVNTVRCKKGFAWLGVNSYVDGYFERSVSQSGIVPKPWHLNDAKTALSRERTVNAIALLGNKGWPSLLAELYQHPPTTGRLRA